MWVGLGAARLACECAVGNRSEEGGRRREGGRDEEEEGARPREGGGGGIAAHVEAEDVALGALVGGDVGERQRRLLLHRRVVVAAQLLARAVWGRREGGQARE